MSKFTYILFIIATGLLYSCNKDDVAGTADETRSPIILAATGNDLNSSMLTKAVSAFPNNGSIGIVAGYYMPGEPVNWTSYPDINNARATVSPSSSGPVYSFVWDSVKYWPFDNRALAFMAYSPLPNNVSVFIDVTNSVLGLNLREDMPDVLYASANDTSTMSGYSKSPSVPVVDLGEFRHALSQLTIELVADSTMPANIRATSLKVSTSKNIAVFYLERGDNGLAVGEDGSKSILTIIPGSVDFKNNPVSKTVLLFPETEDYTEVLLELGDGIVTFSRSFLMSFFQNTMNPNDPMVLERGKNTTLRLTVKGVPTASDKITLQGTLSDWNQRGNFGINIF